MWQYLRRIPDGRHKSSDLIHHDPGTYTTELATASTVAENTVDALPDAALAGDTMVTIEACHRDKHNNPLSGTMTAAIHRSPAYKPTPLHFQK
jgi:hypothetical protein